MTDIIPAACAHPNRNKSLYRHLTALSRGQLELPYRELQGRQLVIPLENKPKP